MAGIVHEHLEDMWEDLGEIHLEIRAQSSHYLLHQQDDGGLHGGIDRPVMLQ